MICGMLHVQWGVRYIYRVDSECITVRRIKLAHLLHLLIRTNFHSLRSAFQLVCLLLWSGPQSRLSGWRGNRFAVHVINNMESSLKS